MAMEGNHVYSLPTRFDTTILGIRLRYEAASGHPESAEARVSGKSPEKGVTHWTLKVIQRTSRSTKLVNITSIRMIQEQ